MSAIFGGGSTPTPAPVVTQPAPVIRPAAPVSVPSGDEEKKELKRIKKGVGTTPGTNLSLMAGGGDWLASGIKKVKLGGSSGSAAGSGG